MTDTHELFQTIRLDDEHFIEVGQLQSELMIDGAGFEGLWAARPPEHALIKIHGRETPIPRWQQAYLHDYRFSGQVSTAQPLPALLAPLLLWSRDQLDERLNGVLLNWYDGSLGHYIGPHHDDIRQLIPGTSIVTISFGAVRTFRLRRPPHTGTHDIECVPGMVIVMPLTTNRVWKHEIVKRRRPGRRVSVTLRAFADS